MSVGKKKKKKRKVKYTGWMADWLSGGYAF